MQAMPDDSLLQYLLHPEANTGSSSLSDATTGTLLQTPAVPASAMPQIPASSLRRPSGSDGALQLFGAAPDSWQDYLVNSTSVGDNPQLSSGGASTQVDPKTLRQREKNREAMRRFRERQKEKTRQDQSKVEDLTRELEQLRAEKEQLEAENRTLREDRSHSGPVCGAALGPAVGSTGTPHPDRSGSSPDSCELAQEDPPHTWEPRHSWEDFDPRATMLLHWSPFSDQPIRLDQAAVKAMTSEQMQALKMAMLAKASPHTSLPWHSLDDAAKAFLQGLKNEMCGLCSNLMLNNPRVLYDKYSKIPDAATVARLLKALDLSTAQIAALVEVNNLVAGEVQRLQGLQQQTLQQMQEALQQDVGLNQGYIMSYPSSRILAIKMARYSEDLHRCGCSYGFTVFYKVLDPVQCVQVMKELGPYSNTWPLTMALAEQRSADATDQQARKMAENGMCFLHDLYRRHDVIPISYPDL